MDESNKTVKEFEAPENQWSTIVVAVLHGAYFYECHFVDI